MISSSRRRHWVAGDYPYDRGYPNMPLNIVEGCWLPGLTASLARHSGRCPRALLRRLQTLVYLRVQQRGRLTHRVIVHPLINGYLVPFRKLSGPQPFSRVWPDLGRNMLSVGRRSQRIPDSALRVPLNEPRVASEHRGAIPEVLMSALPGARQSTTLADDEPFPAPLLAAIECVFYNILPRD